MPLYPQTLIVFVQTARATRPGTAISTSLKMGKSAITNQKQKASQSVVKGSRFRSGPKVISETCDLFLVGVMGDVSMEKLELEVYSQATNQAIVKMPGRRYPGLVIQGDSMSGLADRAESIFERAKSGTDAE